ncbi:MAG: LysR family transcriptional regulator, partial [Pseudomonadota bacterium]
MVPRVPSLNWLRVFEAAARAGSFARAAEILNMSPPAVSQQIKALEGALGQKLFLRGARSVTLTEVGRTYLPSVVRALHSIENTTVNLFGGSEERTLTVKCNLLFLTGWLAPRVLEFQRQHPHVRLTLAEDTQDNPWVAEDQCLKILFEGSFAGGDRRDVLFGERIYPVALPQIAAEIETAEDLLRYPLVDVPTHRANWWSFLPAS